MRSPPLGGARSPSPIIGLGIAQSIACLDILSGLRSIVGTNRSAQANLPTRRAMI